MNPARPILLAPLLVVLACLGVLPAAAADEVVSGPRPVLAPQALDLLPLDDLERARFNTAHGPLTYRAQAAIKRVRTLDARIAQQRAARAKAKGAERKKIDAALAAATKERKQAVAQRSALLARLTDELVADGMNPVLIPVLNAAPQGPGRLERHSHRLVMLVPELDADQWDLFHGILERTEGAYQALAAQKERTALALKQAELTAVQARSITATFDQQTRLIDKRFWQLVDYVLDEDQRAALWKSLPNRMKRKSQAKEHLFLLSDLTPSQVSRMRALTNEVEQESAPDTAAVQRVRTLLRDKDLDAKGRTALSKERSDAYKRLAELREFAAVEIKKVLTDAQYHEYLSIPPRLSTNDRRASFQRTLQGFKASPTQKAAVKRLADALREERRAMSREIADLQRQSRDYGPDSPQMMGMQTMMAGARAEGEELQRKLMGRIFLEVLTPEEASAWVLGHWGDKR